jgi:hypothetical protein
MATGSLLFIMRMEPSSAEATPPNPMGGRSGCKSSALKTQNCRNFRQSYYGSI